MRRKKLRALARQADPMPQRAIETIGLQGRRLLVVGATSGVGRAIAAGAAAAGARVVAVGRRAGRLDDLVDERHGDLTAHVGDVRSEDDCRGMVAHAVGVLGGIDALIYATGMSPLGKLLDTDADAWHEVLETNVVGAALVCRHALPHLDAGDGRVVFLSSVSVDDPRPFLVPYGASKAALDSMIRGWRNEHPHLCFTRVVVGPTVSEFSTNWPMETLLEFGQSQAQRGLSRPKPMESEEVAAGVLEALAAPVWVEDVRLMPRNTAPES
jgi:NAD(P)-dependent dehydrogenase (short-subunit alcohol dehydrogenase family)